MSSKKISTTVALSQDVYALLEAYRLNERRSFGWIVDEALRQFFKALKEREGEVHAE